MHGERQCRRGTVVLKSLIKLAASTCIPWCTTAVRRSFLRTLCLRVRGTWYQVCTLRTNEYILARTTFGMTALPSYTRSTQDGTQHTPWDGFQAVFFDIGESEGKRPPSDAYVEEIFPKGITMFDVRVPLVWRKSARNSSQVAFYL